MSQLNGQTYERTENSFLCEWKQNLRNPRNLKLSTSTVHVTLSHFNSSALCRVHFSSINVLTFDPSNTALIWRFVKLSTGYWVVSTEYRYNMYFFFLIKSYLKTKEILKVFHCFCTVVPQWHPEISRIKIFLQPLQCLKRSSVHWKKSSHYFLGISLSTNPAIF